MRKIFKKHQWKLFVLANILASILIAHVMTIYVTEKTAEAQSCAELPPQYFGGSYTFSGTYGDYDNYVTGGLSCPEGYDPDGCWDTGNSQGCGLFICTLEPKPVPNGDIFSWEE